MFRFLSAFIVLLLSSSSTGAVEGNFKVLARSLEKCGRDHDLGTCLRMKALTMLDDALNSPDPVVINDFLSLAPDPATLENDTNTMENDVEKALAENPDKKDEKLDDMIADKMARYLSSRSLQFSIPADLTAAAETGRKKDKKKGGMMMMAAVAMGGMMMQMMMGKIALLAGKALLVGKMALLLSAIIGLKKLMGGGGGGGDSHPQVVYATESHGGGGHSSGGWGRSIFVENGNDSADHLAYRGSTNQYIPPATSRSV